jgi:hypothetical protein
MWTQTRNKAISILCIILLVWCPTIAYADDSPPTPVSPPTKVDITNIDLGKVSQVRRGQHAPFSGVLLSDTAAARLFADIKFSERECQLRLSRELKLNTLQFNTQIEALKLRLQVETTRTTSLLEVKNQRIKYLEENWRPTPWYESGEFWFAMGVVGGILITVGAGYAIGQAGK